jgi:PAS domain S-box-containing protein
MRDDGLGSAPYPDTELDQALSGGQAQSVGRFKYFINEERWEWSDEVQRIHGYEHGEMPTPSTETVLSHKHPDDYSHVVGALEDTRRSKAAFSTRYRMIDKQGKEHRITVVGDLMYDDAGAVLGTQGFVIDVSSAEATYQQRVSDGIAYAVDRRAAIEQAKGMIGVVYGLDEAAAFELLVWLSQRSNIKLRTLAERLVIRFRELSSPALPVRGVYDNALMSLSEH